MNNTSNERRLLPLHICILLLYLFIAVLFFVGISVDDTASAEVATFNTTDYYYFGSVNEIYYTDVYDWGISDDGDTISSIPCSGTIYYLNNTLTFDGISFLGVIDSDDPILELHLSHSGSPCLDLYWQYWTVGGYAEFDNDSHLYPTYNINNYISLQEADLVDDLFIKFNLPSTQWTDLDGIISDLLSIVMDTLVIDVPDNTPVVDWLASGVYIRDDVNVDFSLVDYLYILTVQNGDNYHDNSHPTRIHLTLGYFKNDVLVGSQNVAFYYGDYGDDDIWTCFLSVDPEWVNYYDINHVYLYDSSTPNERVELNLNFLKHNYTLYSIYFMAYGYPVGYHDGYIVGHAAGMVTDKTFVSVIWETFRLPFRLLFGDFDSTNNMYTGGLFNFTLLGVDMRAFCLGLMSVCVVIAIVKFVLGLRS